MFGGVHALQECDYSKLKARFEIVESLGCLFLGPVVRYDSFTGKLGLRTVKQYEHSAQTKSSKKLQHPVLRGGTSRRGPDLARAGAGAPL